MDKIKPTSFELPKNNPLIPEDFSMRSKEERQKNLPPTCIKKIENQYEVWHLQDCVYKMPRAVV